MNLAIPAGEGVVLHGVRSGQGPALVLVHGGATDRHCFDPLLPTLAEHFTVYAYDRRAHGLSGGSDVPIETEVRDLLHVIRATGGEPVRVLAYSYGALTTLAALADAPIHRAVLYEPPMGVPGMFTEGLAETMAGLVASGELDAALRLFMRETFRLADDVIDRFERGPLWPQARACAWTVPTEVASIVRWRLMPERYRDVGAAVRVLVAEAGGNPAFRDIAGLIAVALPGADVVTVGGVPHFAIHSDTERFLAGTLPFLRGE